MTGRNASEIINQLYVWVNATHVFDSETGDHLSYEDYQYIISEDTLELANLLGIDLDEG